MSDLLIQAALEKRLNAIASPLPGPVENKAYTPVAGTPYQKIAFMPATPEDITMGRKLTQYQGLFQVSLLYPQGEGRGAAQTRAQAIRAHFKPPMTLTESGVNVQINDTTRIAAGYQDGDRWVVPVTIPWYAYISS
jgi:hypothetical protein